MSQIATRRGLALAVALSLLVAVLLAVSQQGAEAAGGSYRNYRAIEFNYCGAKCKAPEDVSGNPNGLPTDREGGPALDKANELIAKVKSWGPDAVFLNEVCLSDLWMLAKRNATVWPGTANSAGIPIGFSIDQANEPLCDAVPDGPAAGSKAHGNAILVPTSRALSNPKEWNMRNLAAGGCSGVSQCRPALCVTVNDTPYSTHLCVAHTNTSAADARTESKNLAEIALSKYPSSGSPVIVGGDLNLERTDQGLDHLYVGGGHTYSKFEEADQCTTRAGHINQSSTQDGCNEWTKDQSGDGNTVLDRKIDYVFLRQAYFRSNPGTTTVNHSAYSDHGIYLTSARECSTASMAECN